MTAHDLTAPLPGDKLAADTAMGPVTLLVADLDAQTAYYRDAVMLSVLRADGPTVTLGRGATPVIVLEHSPALAHAPSGSAGLFHTAILFDTQAALAASLYSVARHAPGTFTGSADHLVSQAFYFTDPEGNGVELYWDRARSDWSWVHGQVEMDSIFLDPNQYLAEHLTEAGADAAAGGASAAASASAGGLDGGVDGSDTSLGGAQVGHVHLSVGDVATAHRFYVDTLGFDQTAAMGDTALFVSAGGYHHHMAMNVWNSRGAVPRMPALGLGRVDIVVPAADTLGALGERLGHYRVATQDDGRTLSFDDPWNNRLHVTTPGRG